jgi:hypothetical protein
MPALFMPSPILSQPTDPARPGTGGWSAYLLARLVDLACYAAACLQGYDVCQAQHLPKEIRPGEFCHDP